ncbi:MAG: DUF1028 domain-containing protein, partial [Ignavibacteriales bacterium]|nr:DUF1028 domain-containing protein [Ignavibacteriales bacterium]
MRTSIISILVLFLFLTAISQEENMIVPAYSIVGWDSVTGDLGVAVVSKFLSVGSIVPYAKAGVGAIVTQNIPNPEHGIYGLKMLEEGMNALAVVEKLIQNESAYQRQLGIIDASGNVYAYTGSGCEQYAGHSFGRGYSVQGTRLANMTVIKAMAMTFEMTQGD